MFITILAIQHKFPLSHRQLPVLQSDLTSCVRDVRKPDRITFYSSIDIHGQHANVYELVSVNLLACFSLLVCCIERDRSPLLP